MAHFYVVFIWNSTRPRKLKQPFQFWPLFEWFLCEIILDHSNWSNLSILTRFRVLFVWNRSRPRKSKQPFQFWPVFEIFFVGNHTRPRKSKQPVQIWPAFEWFLYEILQYHANGSNLFNFDLFLNGFCMKSC